MEMITKKKDESSSSGEEETQLAVEGCRCLVDKELIKQNLAQTHISMSNLNALLKQKEG